MAFAPLRAARLGYEIYGPADAPVLVLSHSIGASMRMWDRVAPRIAGAFRVLRYDTRGHGGSSIPSGPYSIADLGGDVIELLNALGIDRCIFCGLSLGGMTGMWLGANAPKRIEKLILANTAAQIGTRDLWDARIRAVREGGLASMADAVLARWFTPQFMAAEPDAVRSTRQMLSDTPAEGYANCCTAIRDADLQASLSLITAPTLVIAGAFDPATTAVQGQVLAEKIPKANYVELATSHLSAIENPRAFTAAVLGFLGVREV